MGQPHPHPAQPISGQIFWEPLYKPQLGSKLFPGEASGFMFCGSPEVAGIRRPGRSSGAERDRVAGVDSVRASLQARGCRL